MCSECCVCNLCLLRHIPSHQFKPVETIIEGVISRQRAVAVFLGSGGHFTSTVIHLSHLLQPLSANDDRVLSILINEEQRANTQLT